MLRGREHEISILRRVLDSGVRSVGQSALIEGGPGMGKTSLLHRVANLAQAAGFLTVSARGRQREQGIPFTVAHHLLESMPVGLNGDRTEVLRLHRNAAGALNVCTQVEDLVHLGVVTAFCSLIKEITGRDRLVVVIDDLQWVDAPSLYLLDHLMARLENVAVNVIATYTPGHPGTDTPLLADLTSQFSQRLALRNLDELNATRLLAERLGSNPDGEFATACLEETRCNPLFLHALSREIIRRGIPQNSSGAAEIAEIGPAEIAETLFIRYLGESSRTAMALERVAALAESASPDRVAEMTGASRAELDTYLRLPIDLGLIRAEPDLYSFVHPVLRNAMLNRLPATVREGLHLASAQVLHKSGAPNERVARELLLADATEQQHWAPEVLYEAAGDAVSENRKDDARQYLYAALDVCRDDFRGRLLRRLGQLELDGNPSIAAEYLRRALEFPWPEQMLVTINTEAAHALYLSDGPAAAAEALSSGLEKIANKGDRIGIKSDLQVFKMMAGTGSVQDDETDGDGSVGQTDQKRALLRTLRELWSGRSRARAVEHAEQAVRANWVFPGNPMGPVIPLVTMVYGDEFAAAQAGCDHLMKMSVEHQSEALGRTALLLQSLIDYRIGDLAQCHNDAIDVLERLAGASGDHGHGATRRFAASKAVAALQEMGSYDEAQRQLELDWPSDSCDGLDSALLFLERGRLRVATGAVRDGLRDLEECGDRTTALGQENPAVCPWRSEMALAYIAFGNQDEAIRLAEEELERARVWATPRALGIALRVAGMARKDHRGLELLAESHEVLSGSSALLERARTHTHLGIGLRKRNRLAEARKHLGEARILAERCGARPLSEMASREFIAAGGRPRRGAQIGPEALTPSEHRVAMLAAEGRTNREIADELHVLQRTVEIHLSRTYHKLGISGRHRLAAAISPQRSRAEQPSTLVTATSRRFLEFDQVSPPFG